MKRFKINYVAVIFLIVSALASQAQVVNIPGNRAFFTGSVPNFRKTVGRPVTADKIIQAINQVSNRRTGNRRGGTVIIPSGTHTINKQINVKSNVHIRINKNATLRPTRGFGGIFTIGVTGRGSQSKVTNVRISLDGGSGKYTIDYSRLRPVDKIAAFDIGFVENFEIRDARILDNKTFLSAFNVTPPSGGSFNRKSKNGIVQNCSISNADYGYGLVQVQVGENLLFKNLSGTGGVTVRFESGWSVLTRAGKNVGTSTRLFAQNISCTNGNAAIMVSPHTKPQGTAVIKGVTAKNCGFGVRLDRGFAEHGQSAGKYRSVIIGGALNISRTGGDRSRSSQIKVKHYIYYPEAFRNSTSFNSLPRVGGRDEAARRGPGIGPMIFDAQQSANNVGSARDGHYRITYRKNGPGNSQSFRGYTGCVPPIVYEDDKRKVCRRGRRVLSDDLLESVEETNEPKIYPIPTSSGNITVDNITEGSSIKIYGISGNLIKLIEYNKINNKIIDVSNLTSGMYILEIQYKEDVFVKNIIIN